MTARRQESLNIILEAATNVVHPSVVLFIYKKEQTTGFTNVQDLKTFRLNEEVSKIHYVFYY